MNIEIKKQLRDQGQDVDDRDIFKHYILPHFEGALEDLQGPFRTYAQYVRKYSMSERAHPYFHREYTSFLTFFSFWAYFFNSHTFFIMYYTL